jgi:hypothetical protein
MKMKRKIIVMATICLLLMLVIPLNSATKTNNEVEFHVYAGQRGGSVGIGVSYEATNYREVPVNVSFIFYPLCFRPWSHMGINRVVQPQDTVKETFYFPIFSIGVVLTEASEWNSSYYVERIGYHIGQLVFLNPDMS